MISAALIALALCQAPPALTLDQALKEAGERNPDLLAAQARLQQARQLSWKSWAGYLPHVSLAGAYTRHNVEASVTVPLDFHVRDFGTPQGPAFDPARPEGTDNPHGGQTTYGLYPSEVVTAVLQKQDQLEAQLSVSQALVVPALWPAIANAYTAERAAASNAEATRRELLFGVAQVYYGTASLRSAIALQERLLALAHESEKKMAVRFRQGASSKLAVLRAQIERIRVEQDLRRAQNGYHSSRQALATLLDRAPDFEVEQPAPPALPEDVAALQAQALDRRPDVAAARAAEAQARGVREGAWYRYLPSLVGTATYRVANTQGFTGRYDSWALGLGLSWNIFDGGLREAEARESAAREAEAAAVRRGVENKARQELAQGLLDLDSARAGRAKAEEQVKLARESFQIANVSHQAGAATDLEVQEAQTALDGAENAAVAEALNTDLAALRVLAAAGAFDPR